MQRDPKIWGDDAEEYRPSRFLGENAESDATIDGFVPFGAGVRSCVGKRFAQMELSAILAPMLYRFNFAIDETKPYFEAEEITFGPREMWMRLTPRNR